MANIVAKLTIIMSDCGADNGDDPITDNSEAQREVRQFLADTGIEIANAEFKPTTDLNAIEILPATEFDDDDNEEPEND